MNEKPVFFCTIRFQNGESLNKRRKRQAGVGSVGEHLYNATSASGDASDSEINNFDDIPSFDVSSFDVLNGHVNVDNDRVSASPDVCSSPEVTIIRQTQTTRMLCTSLHFVEKMESQQTIFLGRAVATGGLMKSYTCHRCCLSGRLSLRP